MVEHVHPSRQIAFGDFILHIAEASLTCRGEPVPLAPKEFEVLCILARHSGHLVHKELLMNEVWPDTFVSDSSVFRNISVLRKYLGRHSIRTIPKRGYLFTLPVTESTDSIVFSAEREDLSALQSPAASSPGSIPVEPVSVAADPADANPDNRAGRLLLSASLVSRLLRPRFLVFSAACALSALALAPALHVVKHRFMVAHQPTPAAQAIENTPEMVAGGARLFLLNEHGNTLSILNTSNSTLESTVPMDADPTGAAILPDGSAIYVSLNHAGRVVALDTRTRRLLASIPVGNGPVGIVANPRPPFVYVANNYSNSVSVIDSRTKTVIRELHVGSVPTEIAINAEGTRAVVTNQSGGSVTILDTVANKVINTIPVGATPVGIAFTRDSKFAWVTLTGQHEIAVIDINAARIAQRIPVAPGPIRIAFTRDDRYALVSSFFSNTLAVIDTASHHPIRSIAVGLNPVGIAFNPAGDIAYVANYGSNTVSVIAMRNLAVTGTIAVGLNPVEMAVLPCYAVPCG